MCFVCGVGNHVYKYGQLRAYCSINGDPLSSVLVQRQFNWILPGAVSHTYAHPHVHARLVNKHDVLLLQNPSRQLDRKGVHGCLGRLQALLILVLHHHVAHPIILIELAEGVLVHFKPSLLEYQLATLYQ